MSYRTFVMGPNGIGKSNFLDAIRFLADIARPGGGICYALQARGGLEKIRFFSAKKKELVEIEVHLADSPQSEICWSYSLGLASGSDGSPRLAYERVQCGDDLLLNRPDENDALDPPRLDQTHLEQLSSNAAFRDVANFLGSVGYLKFIPDLFRHQHPFPPADLQSDPFGRMILQRAAKMPAKEREMRIRIIEDILKMSVPQLRKLRFEARRSGDLHIEGTFDVGRPRARHQQDLLSDGTLTAFAILWSYAEDVSMLLLEKPETTLGPETIHSLSFILYYKSALGNKQIIMSTHSPQFLKDEIRPVTAREIVLLMPGSYKEGTVAFLASTFPPIVSDMKKGFKAEEIISDYIVPIDSLEMLLDFIGLDLFPDDEH